MKIKNYVFIFSILFAFIILIIIMSIGPSPCFSQDFVEEYISKYSKDFTFLNNKSYTLGINGFTESSETDWYFHDNELDFDFHVKTLKSEYPPKGKHIACNYYDSYFEKYILVEGDNIKSKLNDIFDGLYEIEDIELSYHNEPDKFIISVKGEKRSSFSKEFLSDFSDIAADFIFESIEKYDPNFKNRTFLYGWDVGLNTDWSDEDNISILINGYDYDLNEYFKK